MADAWLLGIEIGGTKLQLGLGRADGELAGPRAAARRPRTRRAGDPRPDPRRIPRLLLERSGLSPAQIRGVGVGFGGPVDVGQRDGCRRRTRLPGWDDFPLADWIARAPGNRRGRGPERRRHRRTGRSPLRRGGGLFAAPLPDHRQRDRRRPDHRRPDLPRGRAGRRRDRPHGGSRSLAARRTVPASSSRSRRAGGSPARPASRAEHAIDRKGRRLVVLDRAGGDPRAITAELVAQAADGGRRAGGDVLLDRSRQALPSPCGRPSRCWRPGGSSWEGACRLIGETHWFEPIRRSGRASVFAPFRGSFDIVPAALGEEVVVHGALALAQDAARQASSETLQPPLP